MSIVVEPKVLACATITINCKRLLVGIMEVARKVAEMLSDFSRAERIEVRGPNDGQTKTLCEGPDYEALEEQLNEISTLQTVILDWLENMVACEATGKKPELFEVTIYAYSE